MIVFQVNEQGMPCFIDYDTGETVGFCERWELEFGPFDIARLKMSVVIQNYHRVSPKFIIPRVENRSPIQATAELVDKPKQLTNGV